MTATALDNAVAVGINAFQYSISKAQTQVLDCTKAFKQCSTLQEFARTAAAMNLSRNMQPQSLPILM